MIKEIQTMVNDKDDRDLKINAVDEEGVIIHLYDIKFSKHAMLTQPLVDDLVEKINQRLRFVVMVYNEKSPTPPEDKLRRAEAVARQIIRKMGMKPH